MYNNSYEEYIRNLLRYDLNPMINDNLNNQIYDEYEYNTIENNQEIHNMYPEIYKIVYPLVCKNCMNIRENISEELVNKIVDDIYINIEGEGNNSEQVRNAITNSKNAIASNKMNQSMSNTNEKRNCNSCTLKELIKVLVLRELFGNPVRPGIPPMRPPFGPKPNMRPPYIM